MTVSLHRLTFAVSLPHKAIIAAAVTSISKMQTKKQSHELKHKTIRVVLVQIYQILFVSIMMFVSIIKFVEAHKYCVIFFPFFLLP
jgi:hypothetical protein